MEKTTTHSISILSTSSISSRYSLKSGAYKSSFVRSDRQTSVSAADANCADNECVRDAQVPFWHNAVHAPLSFVSIPYYIFQIDLKK